MGEYCKFDFLYLLDSKDQFEERGVDGIVVVVVVVVAVVVGFLVFVLVVVVVVVGPSPVFCPP